MGPMVYRDRRWAGEALARELGEVAGDPVVLGLPRGGVVVAGPVAEALGAPLDVLVARKLGVPWQPELGMGAVAEGGVVALNPQVIRHAGLSPEEIEAVRRREEAEVDRRARRYRADRPRVALAGRTAVIVDDGLATGYTARAAIEAARAAGAARIVLAVPVGAPSTVAELELLADEVVCPLTPPNLMAVGQWYDDFRQVEDGEVVEVLERAARPAPGG